MTAARQRAIGAVAAVLIVAFATSRLAGRDTTWSETLYVFGTLVEIEIRDSSPRKAKAVGADVARQLNAWHRDWHAWKPGALSQLNAAIADGAGAHLDAQLLSVLDQGAHLACLSGGLFEPAIGKLIDLWGFHQDTRPSGAPPSTAAVTQLRATHPRMDDLSVADGFVTSENPAVSLDLGGYAKGVALDMAAQALEDAGVQNAILNAGGDVNVLGDHGARRWRVAIRDPFVWGAIAAIDMAAGEVLYTSGNYERYLDHNGERFAHIIDPRSGWPVQDVVSVSVLARDGALADAAATALSVAGDDWPWIAGRMGVDAVLVIHGDGTMDATPAMAARLNWIAPHEGAGLKIEAPILPATVPDCPGLRRVL